MNTKEKRKRENQSVINDNVHLTVCSTVKGQLPHCTLFSCTNLYFLQTGGTELIISEFIGRHR